MPYLVDTDVLIDVSRNVEAAVEFLDQLDDSWSVSIITALELVVGARNKKEVSEIDQLVEAYSAIPLNSEIGNASYNLLRQFATSHGLRVFDSLIAASALEHNLTLVTRNKKHFHMIGALRLLVPSY
ncbi:MAG TPA: type II toxin-antitoxin system VapC family toxin [Pyrinomonadaceae bacterium]|nr:type II toxin-antitoxin system VapC family toxin [Pyrinomonadaceae bacterium]